MKITWIGETTSSPAFGELKAGKLLEIPDDVAKVWVGQGVAKPTKAPDPEPAEQIKTKKTAKAGGGRK
jgi:hypothetical protein